MRLSRHLPRWVRAVVQPRGILPCAAQSHSGPGDGRVLERMKRSGTLGGSSHHDHALEHHAARETTTRWRRSTTRSRPITTTSCGRRDPRLARKHGSRAPASSTSLRDGKSFLPFLAEGWRVTACDVSPHMLDPRPPRRPGVSSISRRAGASCRALDLVHCSRRRELPRERRRAGAGACHRGSEPRQRRRAGLDVTARSYAPLRGDGHARTTTVTRVARPHACRAEPGVLAEAALEPSYAMTTAAGAADGGVHQQRHHSEGRSRRAGPGWPRVPRRVRHGLDGRPSRAPTSCATPRPCSSRAAARQETKGGDPCCESATRSVRSCRSYRS